MSTVASASVGELTGDWNFLADLARRRNVADLLRPPSSQMGYGGALFLYAADSGSVRFNSPEGRFEPLPSLGRKTVKVGIADLPKGRQIFVGIFAETYDRNRCPAISADGRPLLPQIIFPVLLDTAGLPIAVRAPSPQGMGGVLLSAEQTAELSPLVVRGLEECTAQIAELLGANPTPDLPPSESHGDISAF